MQPGQHAGEQRSGGISVKVGQQRDTQRLKKFQAHKRWLLLSKRLLAKHRCDVWTAWMREREKKRARAVLLYSLRLWQAWARHKKNALRLSGVFSMKHCTPDPVRDR